MQPLERYAANSLATYFGLKPKKVEGVRVGKLNAVEVLLEISVTDRREGKIVKQVHLGKPGFAQMHLLHYFSFASVCH